MEFEKIKIHGEEFTLIFNGPKYVLHSEFFGLVAVADRTTDFENIGGGKESFTIRVGNKNTIGGSFTDSVIVSAMKKKIRKMENKYIKKEIYFDEVHENLDESFLKIEVLPMYR